MKNFTSIGDQLMKVCKDLDTLMVMRRTEIQHLIEAEEWQQLIDMVVAETNAQKERESTKATRGKLKSAFDKVDATIESTMQEGHAKSQVVIAAVRLREAYNALENNAVDKYGSDNAIIICQKSTGRIEQLDGIR